MAKTKTIRVTDEELAAIEIARKRAKASDDPANPNDLVTATDAQKALANAFVEAIERTKPPEKKTVLTRKKNTPWSPPEGEPRLKLKRKMYHHGILIGENISNEEIELLNRVKPGRYCDGYVQVTLRKDRGLDIDYPVRTTSQRLRLVNQFGITSFASLLKRIIDEKTNPSKYRKPEDTDLYDFDE